MIVLAAAVAVGLWTWFETSTFVPLAAEGQPVEYVFVGAPVWWGVAAALATAAVLALIARRRGSADFARPLRWLAAAHLAAIALVPGLAARVPVFFYLLVDLRPWWTAAVVVSTLFRLGLRPVIPTSPRVARVALWVGLMAWGIATTPYLRFDASLHGDEPKYLRFCEDWYQGNGLEVGRVRTMAQLGPTFSPPLWRNVMLFGSAVREDAALAVSDLRLLAAEGLRARFNRAEYAQAWIVRGRNGSYYQLHNPGLSALLFPAYLIDRHFIAAPAGYQGVFPSRLYATNLAVLALWAGWGVSLFALVRVVAGDVRVAFALSALVMLTMPMSAFGFQIYPEAAAGIIVCAVLAWTLQRASDDRRLITAVAAGAAAGFLPWLHVRLIVLSVVLAGWAAARARRGGWVTASYAVMILGLCAYAYHITGSVRPDAMYAAQGAEAAWTAAEARQSIVSLPFDRIWGFLPHAPLYLMSIPGWVVLARRSPDVAGGLAMLLASLAVPVAGHGFTAAGATPLRQLASVLPLLVVPLWHTLMSWGRVRGAQIVLAILAVLSLDTAMSYNLHHLKHVGRYVDAGFSGWAPNLLFPWTHGPLWASHRGTFVLFAGWIVVCGVLVLLALRLRRSEVRASMPIGRAVQVGVVAFLVFASGATALGGEMVRRDYLVPVEDAHRAAVMAALAQDRCRLCFSSARGPLGRSNIISVSEQRLTIDPVPAVSAVDEDVRIRFRLSTDSGIGWGTVAVDFGDGTSIRRPVAGGAILTHRYTRPGTYRVTVRFDAATGAPKQQTIEMTIR